MTFERLWPLIHAPLNEVLDHGTCSHGRTVAEFEAALLTVPGGTGRTLAIPVYPHLSDAQVEHIADTVCEIPLPRSAHRAKNTDGQHRLHHTCASRLPCH